MPLASYARDNPPSLSDAEEGQECPLQELDLLVHFKGTGAYQRNRSPKRIPFELFGYACARAFPSAARWTEVLLSEATFERGGPGRVFQLDEEGIFDLGMRLRGTGNTGAAGSLATPASARLRVRTWRPIEWIQAYYDRLRARSGCRVGLGSINERGDSVLSSFGRSMSASMLSIQTASPTSDRRLKTLCCFVLWLRSALTRAHLVVAPYGSGKSIAAAYLLHLVENRAYLVQDAASRSAEAWSSVARTRSTRREAPTSAGEGARPRDARACALALQKAYVMPRLRHFTGRARPAHPKDSGRRARERARCAGGA